MCFWSKCAAKRGRMGVVFWDTVRLVGMGLGLGFGFSGYLKVAAEGRLCVFYQLLDALILRLILSGCLQVACRHSCDNGK